MTKKNLQSLGVSNMAYTVNNSRSFIVPFANYTTATGRIGDTMVVTTADGFYVFQFNANTTGGAGSAVVKNIGTFSPYRGTAF